jgi:hypothetical protein
MGARTRTWICAAAVWLALLVVPAGAQAGFGVRLFEAGTCKTNVPECTYTSPHSQFFTQAAGHPPLGITTFELNHKEGLLNEEPEGAIKRVRIDVPPGLAANPQALPQCSEGQFGEDKCPASSQVGTTEITAWLSATRTTVTGTVYNLTPPPEKHIPLLFGIHVEVPLVANEHIFLVGHVDWSGDFHEYFEIDNISKALPVLKSKLLFNGNAGKGNFITLPSVCSSTTTSYIEVESYEGAVARGETHTPVGVEGCGEVPFAPSVLLTPEAGSADAADGATIDVHVPQNEGAGEVNTSDVQDVRMQLPEGMTLNPAAANGLAACTAEQFLAAGCPQSAELGAVTIETDLPPHSLTGALYLGSPSGGTITAPPFTVYIVATSVYGVVVRLEGQVTPNPATGRLETTFLHAPRPPGAFFNNPQLPFSDLIVKLKGGPRAPLANPLLCAGGVTETLFTPYSGGASWLSKTPFATEGAGGGPCPPAPPFAPTQGSSSNPTTAGAPTSYSFALARPEGHQYLQKISTALPAGLVGLVPSVSQCPEPAASTGNCPAASQIGVATVAAGSGSEPYPFTGPVYFTGPYGGAPFGLSIPIEAAAGPFDLGRVVTRTAISVDPVSARVIATSVVPTIVAGVPVRLRGIDVTINRPGFMVNPTSCEHLLQESTLTSTLLASARATSPFQVSGCGGLAFQPSVSIATNRLLASRVNGIGLDITATLPAHDSNVRSVVATLPLQLPSRLTTLQKACLPGTFAADPAACPAESVVGSASVVTPVLPVPLTGPAYLVAKGGAQFPDLDLVLQGDGVRVTLVSNTAIHNGITTSTFASLPDVPFSSFRLTLPPGPHSALASYGDLCATPLSMPMVWTAQSGAQVHMTPRIAVTGCGMRIVRRRRAGRFVLVTVQTYTPGKVTASGRGLRKASSVARRPGTITLKLAISRRVLHALRHRHHRVRLKIAVAFSPLAPGEPGARASTALLFKR